MKCRFVTMVFKDGLIKLTITKRLHFETIYWWILSRKYPFFQKIMLISWFFKNFLFFKNTANFVIALPQDFPEWKVSMFGFHTLRISPYSVQMWENTDQKNSEYGHFSHSVYVWPFFNIMYEAVDNCGYKLSLESF